MKFRKIITFNIKDFELDAEYWKRIDSLTEKRVNILTNRSELKKVIFDADCLLIGFSVQADKEIIDSSPQLKYIGKLGTAYGNIDTNYAASKRIVVTNIPGYSTESVAEFVFAIILDHVREIERGKQQARVGNYSESGFSATEIKDKNFGIIGLGKIGNRVGEIAHGFDANVLYWSRNRKKELETKGIKYDDVEVIISKSDFLSLHLALNKDTENFLNEERIMKIKKGAVVINTSPMELVDINALEKRLAKGDITFILDHSDEMTEENLKKLSKYENCIIYPPIAYVSKEARIEKQEIFVNNIENFLKGNTINKVN